MVSEPVIGHRQQIERTDEIVKPEQGAAELCHKLSVLIHFIVLGERLTLVALHDDAHS